MNAPAPAAPLRLQWLADARRRPRALWLRPGPGALDTLSTLVTDESWQTLCAQLPCCLDEADAAALSPEAWQALAQAGWQRLAAGQPLRADTAFPAPVAAGAWVAGPWYLQAPAQPNAGQAASRTRALQLVELVSSDAETRDIEAVLRQDATLSYHLLRLVNSLAMGGEREITSFAQAILILGRQQLRRWLNLMLFAARDDDPRAPMLMAHVSVRARTMELLAQACGGDRMLQEQAFMAGMFSLLGVLFGMPLAKVIQSLGLSAPVQDALLAHTGELGRQLRAVELSETDDWDELAQALQALDVSVADFNRIRTDAVRWMLELTRET